MMDKNQGGIVSTLFPGLRTWHMPLLGCCMVLIGLLAVTGQAKAQANEPYVVHMPIVVNGFGDAFYEPPDLGGQSTDDLGQVLRYEHISSYSAKEVTDLSGSPANQYGAEVYRILYTSLSISDTVEAVSGLLLIPTAEVTPTNGFPLLVHAHLNLDQADQAAPSKNSLTPLSLLFWVAQGFVVTATDYAGLGTPGPRYTLVGEVEARSLLDSARAALKFQDAVYGFPQSPARNQIILEGASIGGHAALFAQQEGPTYAPELNIVGTAVYAPVTELRLLAATATTPPATALAPLVSVMYAYSQYYGAPQNPATWLREPYATELAEQAANGGLVQLVAWLGTYPDLVFQESWLQAVRDQHWDEIQPWTTYIDTNTAGNYASTSPVLIIQGEMDTLNVPAASQRLTERLCTAGTVAKVSLYPGVGHVNVVYMGRTEVLRWVQDRLAGVAAAPSSCPE